MSHLSLAFLGAPEVRHTGRLLTFRTRKALGLLVYLAVTGSMHSREKLTVLFWPESDVSQGRMMVRSTLARLRTALDDASEQASPHHLIVERDALGFDFTSPVDLDLHTLEIAFKRSQGLARVEDLQGEARRSLLAQLQAAVDRYRGNFLDGFYLSDAPDFEDWTRLQREVWHRRMSTVFDRLTQVQSDGGELPGAIDTTRRWVTHDPLNEIAHQRLVQLYLIAGDRTSALRAYEKCRATLAKELHARPAPETEALAERIRAQAPSRHALSAPSRTEETVPRPPLLPDVALVGRASEFGRLIDAYQTVQRGQTQVMILKGEAGIGKTRLASDFLGWVAAHGADVLKGRAFETGGRLPYQPLVESLRSRIEQENAPDDLLSDLWLAELSRLLPELRDRYPDLPLPTADETTARIRLFEAVVRLGQALAERTQVVLFIDDVHRIDAASRDLLHYTGRRWLESGTRILLLLSLRSEALVTTKTLTSWLADLEQDVHATSLVLESLTLEDTLQLVQAFDARDGTTPAAPGQKTITKERATRLLEGFGRWLFVETSGQPFYVMETLKALLERGLLARRFQTDGSWAIDFNEPFHSEAWTLNAAKRVFAPTSGFLPQGVREVIRSRLNQVTPAAFTLLVAGAILGHDFPFEHLYQVAGLGEIDGLPALDEVLASRLLSEGDETRQTQAGTYFFTHDKIRDVVYTEAGEARRRIFHRRAFEILNVGASLAGTLSGRQVARAAPAAELAHHALAAGLPGPAFRWSVAAGDDAMKLFAVRDALTHYEQARELLIAQPAQHPAVEAQGIAPTSDVQHLYVQLGRAYELLNDTEQGRLVYESMLAFAQKGGLSLMELAALNHLVTVTAQNPFEVERAEALLTQTLEVAERTKGSSESTPTVEEAETEWNLAQLTVYRFDLEAALVHGEHALTIAQQLGVQELVARSRNVLSYALMNVGRWEESERSAEEAALLYRALGNRALEADSLCMAALAKINGGQPHAAISTARAAHTISLEIENSWSQGHSALYLAQGLLEIGFYAEALRILQEAVTLARTHHLYLVLALGLILLGVVHRAMLNPDAARSVHLELMGMIEHAKIQPLIEVLTAELCADCVLAGAWEDAHTYALQALAARTDAFVAATRLARWYETEALVYAGDREPAVEDVRRFGERIGNSRRYRIPYLRALALLAQYCSEIDEAIGHLQEAAKLAEEIGLPGELWSIQAALGDLFIIGGDAEQARGAFKQAAVIVQKLADNIGNDEMRTTFLVSPLVRRVLEQA